ncbi:MAG: MazG nucleotide pyrophosphohydrolase domain-containing protein [Myxococcota bacterium]
MSRSMLDEVRSGGTALREGQKLGARAASVGFDWATALQALEKVEEEVSELRAELEGSSSRVSAESADRLEDEIGDVLFAVANVARKLDIDAEDAMARTNRKFRERFASIESSAAAQGRDVEEMTLEEMEAIWQQAKK